MKFSVAMAKDIGKSMVNYPNQPSLSKLLY